MNVDEIRKRTKKFRSITKKVLKDSPKPENKEFESMLYIGLELLEGFLINQANAAYYLEELEYRSRLNT